MELLAVIVILAVILLIAVPSVINIIDKAKQGTYENQLALIEKMAETYALTIPLSYDENGEAYFTLGDMMEVGVSPTPVTDPRCGKNFVDETEIKSTQINGLVTFEIDAIISECEIDGVAPEITSVTTTATSTSITVNVVATSEGSSIKNYYYSKDNGNSWVNANTSSTYTFTNLEPNTEYTIVVRAKNTEFLSVYSTGEVTKTIGSLDGLTSEEVSDLLEESTSDEILSLLETLPEEEKYELMDTVTEEAKEAIWEAIYKEDNATFTDVVNVSLTNGMIPIIYNGTNWEVADTSSTWYNYDNQLWANAISVSSSVRSSYKVGKVVSEADVLAYYVYIPRYKYQIFNTGTTSQTGSEQTINIEFQTTSDTKATGSTVGSWLTHPAFTFGDEELEGIWVGKFAITGSISALTIKPKISSVRGQTNSSFFYAIQTMSASGNSYGLSTSSDAHMMKNTEWGAAAYLSHSKYGINTEITINNNSNFTTGCGGATVDAESTTVCTIAYGSQTSQPQSSTGNITGIYDMSGGGWERVMGVYAKTVSSSGFATSFFTTNSNDKYYNNYASDISSRILGDATAETIAWYSDYSNFLSASDPWFCRGGHQTNAAFGGLFAYSTATGHAGTGSSTRVVVLP